MIFNYLPLDIIHHVLSYNDVIKNRNGKYMNQICKEDTRYKLLLKISPIDYSFILVKYRPTNTLWVVTLTFDSIYYTFWYDAEDAPQKFNLWIRN